MKLVAIGDLHGRDTWKKIVEGEKDADTIVFIGDYLDAWNISPGQQLTNLTEILEYKKANPEKVVLLMGNHDFQYLTEDQRYSGYNSEYAGRFRVFLQSALDEELLQIAYEQDGYLFTHAGVTKTWGGHIPEYLQKHMALRTNSLFSRNPDSFNFYPGDTSGCGESIHQSPLWVRPDSLLKDFWGDMVQVVGHTSQDHITYYEGPLPHKLIMIDAIEAREYLKITDYGPQTMHL